MVIHSSILAWEILWTVEPWATVHGVAKSWTWLKTHTHTHTRALGAAGGLQKEQCWDKAGLRERAEVTKGGFLVTEASPESSPVTSNKKFFKKGESSSSKFLFKWGIAPSPNIFSLKIMHKCVLHTDFLEPTNDLKGIQLFVFYLTSISLVNTHIFANVKCYGGTDEHGGL